jgi:pimeloyl-ACP methyl ester carboxylesterase
MLMQVLKTNRYDMAFVERGEGIPLLLVHGSISDYRWWSEQMEPFGKHYRTIAVSLRHFWPERWNGEGDGFTIQQHTLDVAAFISALDAGPIHLLGLSRGGHIAFRVAQQFSDLVRALVLAEPGGVLDSSLETGLAPVGPTLALGPLYTATAEQIRRGKIDEGLAPAINSLVGPGGWERMPEPVKQIMRDNAQTLLGQIREVRVPFTRADAEAIRAPTLLMAGEWSPPAFHRILDGMQTAIPDVRRVSISDASHPSNIDNPRDFEREVLAFLKIR